MPVVKRGRPTLGDTRKVSITLPLEVWVWLDSQNASRSEVLRGAVMNAMNGQIDIYEAIKKAQRGEHK